MTDVTFYIHGFEGIDEKARGWGPVQDEFQRRGVGCRIIRSPKSRTATPNLDRARIMVEALAGVSGEVALIGISNQGLFMPLVAAARTSASHRVHQRRRSLPWQVVPCGDHG